ncbi:MAG: pyruvate:ferredoxin (flavodoxin) oxidoreductase [Chitinivibrionales bacterium]|nr:pyruvate:ferredoxin (flavodoxin) oxidoreductase [Chitinivibrionales bacterium]
MQQERLTVDGNHAAAHVAYHMNEVIAIYPITPSSPMGELADEWSTRGKPNIYDTVPQVTEMQSEGGAAGAVHGALQRGALTTTFTSSQGLLLMIPNMYKIAGELTPTVFHVAARTVATHALSIFCDHSDIMAVRGTGFAILGATSVQAAMDFAAVAQAASLQSRVPFVHFFDGFRTSHEVSSVYPLTLEQMKAMVDEGWVSAHRSRALSPDHPFIRGTAQNPDVFFQAREASNPWYRQCPDIVQGAMDLFAQVTGRQYHLFDYVGADDARFVIVIMGSAAQTVEETVRMLIKQGEKVGLIKVHLYRPFAAITFIDALPQSVGVIAALDRTKEPGSTGDPLYNDIITALYEHGTARLQTTPLVIGGRYGLSSKEFTPAMVKGVFDHMAAEKPSRHFTVGITDDVSHTSIDYPCGFGSEPSGRTRALFYGLGSDGTVSANRNTIRIIGEQTNNYVQGYFVYDSRKAGSLTVSHLRFGSEPINAPYLVHNADFVGCHQFFFLERLNVLGGAQEGAIFLLNTPYPPDQVWDHLPREVQQTIIDKKLRFFVIDAYELARQVGLGKRINTIMQACFFSLSNIIDLDTALGAVKKHIGTTYGKRGEKVVKMNNEVVDRALDHLHQIEVPSKATSRFGMRTTAPPSAPEFVQKVTAAMIAGEGDNLPVSAFAPDGTFPSGTTRYEKRDIALEIPVWDPQVCIQCGKCVMVCPHAVVRSTICEPAALANAPEGFKSVEARSSRHRGKQFTIQVSVEDCTGCRLCTAACPARNKSEPRLRAINMEPKEPYKEQGVRNWAFFLNIPDPDRRLLRAESIADVQFMKPLFEFHGACGGCGETPYLELMSRLFGDRALIANATGCSSIYGGNLPATPWCTNEHHQGPAWANSLFEDNGEFGFGMRCALDKQIDIAREFVGQLAPQIGNGTAQEILEESGTNEEAIERQRERVDKIRQVLQGSDDPKARRLLAVAEVLVRKTVWIVGGDGWAYDIGYGGLDHILSLGRDVNILVLDSEIYSNTGGQMSKATPMGAVAKFAAAGKPTAKKDLAAMAMTYGTAYVARVAMGANDTHTLKVFREAEAFPGTSLIIAYSHCIGQGFDLSKGMEQQKAAVASGYWPLMRYNPLLKKQGKNPLKLDSKPPSIPLEDYIYNETRYQMLRYSNPERAEAFLNSARDEVDSRRRFYEHWSSMEPAEKEEPEKEKKKKEFAESV